MAWPTRYNDFMSSISYIPCIHTYIYICIQRNELIHETVYKCLILTYICTQHVGWRSNKEPKWEQLLAFAVAVMQPDEAEAGV